MVTAYVGTQGYKRRRGRTSTTRARTARGVAGVRSVALCSQKLMGIAPEMDKVLLAGESQVPEERLTMIGYVSPAISRLWRPPCSAARLQRRRPPGTPEVAIVNEALARRIWPGRGPLGQRFRLAAPAGRMDGRRVVRDSKYLSLIEPPQPYIFRPWSSTTRRS